MKAAIVERPGELVVRDVPVPEVGEYGVLCRLLYGATCTGTDRHIIAGEMHFPIPYPCVLGHESVGVAVEVGPRVRHFRPGDLITRVGAPPDADGRYGIAWGGYAEYGLAQDHRAMREDGLPPERWHGSRVNQRVPDGIAPATATMIITWRETFSYITRLGVGAGHAVLVIGSGGNALAFAAHAHNLGAGPVVMAGQPGREPNAKAVGADALFDYRDADPAGGIAEAYPDGFDYLIDAVGKRGQVDRVLPTLKPGGAIGIYGVDDFHHVAINPRRARGSFTFIEKGYDEEEAHARVVGFVQAGVLEASAWFDSKRAYPLEAIKEAFDALARRETVKALIRLSSGLD
ncbi:MAG TPA: zinc-binding dehydrogenase [Candidatus Hydrogenedentes bacterium]|nr:zinc-binding dehydrogenase [Candidatus Hydrogenedentota bacterium]HPG66772.1 zinc-binding dehydrogenase [Candidatus Hydrogenedentota bacterium]